MHTLQNRIPITCSGVPLNYIKFSDNLPKNFKLIKYTSCFLELETQRTKERYGICFSQINKNQTKLGGREKEKGTDKDGKKEGTEMKR